MLLTEFIFVFRWLAHRTRSWQPDWVVPRGVPGLGHASQRLCYLRFLCILMFHVSCTVPPTCVSSGGVSRRSLRCGRHRAAGGFCVIWTLPSTCASSGSARCPSLRCGQSCGRRDVTVTAEFPWRAAYRRILLLSLTAAEPVRLRLHLVNMLIGLLTHVFSGLFEQLRDDSSNFGQQHWSRIFTIVREHSTTLYKASNWLIDYALRR